MALPRLRFRKASEPKHEVEKALLESALQSEGIVVTGSDKPSTGETIAESTFSRDKAQNLIDSNKHEDDTPGLGNEPDEPATNDRRPNPFDAGSGDLTSIFGTGTSTKDQLAAALGIDPDDTPGGAGSTPGGSTPNTGDGPRGSDGGPTGMWGLGYGRTTHAGTGFADVDSGADHAAIGKGDIANGFSGVAPVGYDEEEGVRAGKGMQDLAKEYPNAPSVSPDKLGGGLGDAMRQALDEVDQFSTEKHQSSDGKVTSERKADGTVIITNTDSGTTTRMNPNGSTVTTDTATGKVIDKSDPNKASQPIDDVAPIPPEYQAVYDALKGDPAAGKPYTGTGDIDPDENPTAPAVGDGGAPVDMKLRFLVDPPGPDSGIAGPRTGTPTLGDFGGLPGDVDPTEDTFIPSGTGPEDDPLSGLDSPGLKPSADQSTTSSDEEEEDDEELD